MWSGSPPPSVANTSGTCYINSALQFLLAAKPCLQTYLYSVSGNRILHASQSDSSRAANYQLVRLVQELTSGRTCNVNVQYLRRLSGAMHTEPPCNNEQEDALEYFLHLLAQIQENFPKQLQVVKPCDLMKIELCEEIQRGHVTSYVRREEYVISCPLHIDAQSHEVNLEDCITKFMSREEIISSHSDSVFKTTRFATLPKYLVFQLRIFGLNSSGWPEKTCIRTNIPDALDVEKWLCNKDWIDKCGHAMIGENDQYTAYSLKAFVTHHGDSADTGHYVCHVKQGEQWYECNDTAVYPIWHPPKENGYFYMYKRYDVY